MIIISVRYITIIIILGYIIIIMANSRFVYQAKYDGIQTDRQRDGQTDRQTYFDTYPYCTLYRLT